MPSLCCPNSNCNSTYLNGCTATLIGSKAITSLIVPGTPITFTITITNTSTCPALNVILVDVLPSNIIVPGSFIISPNGTVDGNVIIINLGTINAGATVVTTITGTLSALVLGSVTNTVFVAGSNVCRISTLTTTFSI